MAMNVSGMNMDADDAVGMSAPDGAGGSDRGAPTPAEPREPHELAPRCDGGTS